MGDQMREAIKEYHPHIIATHAPPHPIPVVFKVLKITLGMQKYMEKYGIEFIIDEAGDIAGAREENEK
jgi:hypothetical protein